MLVNMNFDRWRCSTRRKLVRKRIYNQKIWALDKDHEFDKKLKDETINKEEKNDTSKNDNNRKKT